MEMYFLVGDNAYEKSKVLLGPYTAPRIAQNIQQRKYNFFLSQLRICIEKSFGRLCSWFGIFRLPLCYELTKCTKIIQAAMMLHNFIFDNEGNSPQVVVPVADPCNNGIIYGAGYFPSVDMDDITTGTNDGRRCAC